MPEISTYVDQSDRHDACPERPFEDDSHSPNVFAEGFQVAREGDAFKPHGCSQHPPHGAIVSFGWQTVRVNGQPIAYVGATVTCPSNIVATGRPSVLVGEGAKLGLGR